MEDESKLPPWLNGVLNAGSIRKIEEAVALAEKETAGEIVPILVRRSSVIGHIPFIASLLLAVLVMLVLEYLSASGAIGISSRSLPVLVLLLPLSLLGGSFLSKVPLIQRMLIPQRDAQYQTEIRAEVEFFEAKLTKTRQRTGILLFVSLLERRAVVLADEGIAQKLPPETWTEVVSLLIDGLKKGDALFAFTSAIAKAGNILKAHVPIQSGDTNEIPNRLIIKD